MENSKIKQIGKVNLDLTYYSGSDAYCDGAAEDELLKIVRDYAEVEYPRIIEEKKSWEILYHLSSQRENIVEWLPMDKSMKVLEVGAGCGAVTGTLARKAGSVTCVDLSQKRSMINAYRHMEQDNITIHVGNFQDIEPSLPCDYDYICLIGVLEYGQSYIGGERPFESFLNIVRRHVKKDGRIVIAIENRFGLKYWAGCKEDHLGTYFSGIEGYPEGGAVRTFTKSGLEKIFRNCQIGDYSFYYPYPDYKFMTALYSDAYLPKKGELFENIRNFDRERMILFDEKKVFDSMAEEGLFPLYANSFLVVVGPAPEAFYVKYSSDRKPEYRIRTEILPLCLDWMESGKEDASGKQDRLLGEKKRQTAQLVVRKHPLCEEAKEHVRSIETAYRKLKERYRGGELKINRCKLVEEEGQDNCYVELEYIDGVTLEELLDQCLEQNDREGFFKLFRKYLDMLNYRSGEPAADFDMIFSNILLRCKDAGQPFDALKNSVWTLIDYEWTFGKQMDTKQLAFRAVYCYVLEDEKRNKLNLDSILQELGVTDGEAEEYRKQEKEFQRFVTGNRRSMVEYRDLIGHRCYRIGNMLEKIRTEEENGLIQVYEDTGDGFQEEDSFFVYDGYAEDDKGLHLNIPVKQELKQIRIDPAFVPCMIEIKELRLNGAKLEWKGKGAALSTNGTRLDDSGSFVFVTNDPNLTVSFEGLALQKENELELCFSRAFLNRDMAEDIEYAAKRRLRL